MSKDLVWHNIIKDLIAEKEGRGSATPVEPQWLFYYNDGHRRMVVEHSEQRLPDILEMFQEFCKGAGFVFNDFAIVDEDGIPTTGFNSIAKLESDDEDPSRF